MKYKARFKVIAGAAVLAALLLVGVAGCNLFDDDSVSPRERVDAFMEDMNRSSRSNIRSKHIHPDASDYSTLSTSYFEDPFPTDQTYTLSSVNVSGSTISATINSSDGAWSGEAIEFRTRNDGDVAKIIRLTIDGERFVGRDL
ncbi:hypothetical protein [Spirochaeta africana]|uniref:Lipoprotein n=1 Tax=Spirochaeta africana (strain ATCC 700263 / DSM 8902 / Z-7692) TaxID=889378 RepID=H9UI28_SPIAZ|nr:hypothetical protein [Spirochaeta africana]AFG37171.1 hypothetical protein Spiaf_1084 [Spirochaeta africana DSM 8902]